MIFDIKEIPKTYYALIAKICVTKLVYPATKYINNLVNAVANIRDINKYLDTLLKRKHYSIFGTLYYKTKTAQFCHKYKCFKLEFGNAITLRHVIEGGYVSSLSQFPDTQFTLRLQRISDHVYLVYQDDIQLSLLFVGVSRVFTHQFIRHTIFNFMQVSNRYTEIDAEIYNYLEDLISDNIFLNLQLIQTMKDNLKIYKTYLKSGISKEYARYVAPMGTPTVLFVNGLREHWKNMLDTRLKDASQYEFKKLIKVIPSLL